MTRPSIPDKITPALRKALFAAWHHQCAYCRIRLAEQVDHIFPVARGGEDRLENYTAACQPCNMMKRDLLLAKGYLRILEAKAVAKAPRIRAAMRRTRHQQAGSHLIEYLVTTRMLSRHGPEHLTSLHDEQVRSLREAERAEVLSQTEGWSARQVMDEIGRLKSEEKGRPPI